MCHFCRVCSKAVDKRVLDIPLNSLQLKGNETAEAVNKADLDDGKRRLRRMFLLGGGAFPIAIFLINIWAPIRHVDNIRISTSLLSLGEYLLRF